MKVVALVPARGASKRIPKKNLVDLNGQPLISYVINTARQCDDIAEVWVSTDDDEIAKVAMEFGAKVLRRPPELAEDTSSSEEALLHFAQEVDFDILVFIQATSPLTTAMQLREGVAKVAHGEAESSLAVCEDTRFYWTDQSGHRTPVNYDLLNRPRSQEKEKWYKETGQFYITTKERLLSSSCRVSGEIDFVVVPEVYGWEIDTYEDLDIVSHIIRSTKL